jgi:hypothetical protein
MLPLKLDGNQALAQDKENVLHIEDVIMKFLPPRSKGGMSYCYWHKRPRCINS